MFSLLSRRRIVKSLIQLIRKKYTDKKKCFVCMGNIEIQCTVITEVIHL